MSNQFQSISSGLGMLKIYYQGPMVDQFNEAVVKDRKFAHGFTPTTRWM